MSNRDRDQAELDEILLKDADDIRLKQPDGPTPKPRLRKGRANTPFVMVPMTWVERLAAQHSSAAWTVAVRLLHLGWKSSGQPIVLGNVALRELGIGRTQKWRALSLLERLGLISVERHPRRSPRITLHT